MATKEDETLKTEEPTATTLPGQATSGDDGGASPPAYESYGPGADAGAGGNADQDATAVAIPPEGQPAVDAEAKAGEGEAGGEGEEPKKRCKCLPLACLVSLYVFAIIVGGHILGGVCKVAFAAVELALGIATVAIRMVYECLRSCCEDTNHKHGDVTTRFVEQYDTCGCMRKGFNGIFHGCYIILPCSWYSRNCNAKSDQHVDNMSWWEFYTKLPFKVCPQGVCCDESTMETTVWVR
eukprot:m.11774 g.11774  ORF g.11774 m.11774 type:complete len:238 (-) comp5928_c0_seq1:200-913(-)